MKIKLTGIAPEGMPFIGFVVLATLAFAFLGSWILTVLFLALTVGVMYFFRDPERIVPTERHIAVSPADGTIISLNPRANPMTGESCVCISIFMNLLNVHVNRAPLASKVEQIKYFPGKFFNASLDKASTENERCAYLLRDEEEHAWVMVQIAGLVARRIVCRVHEGDILSRGDRYGLIRFGSRVDLYLPPEYTPTVAIGQKVKAGESLVARCS